MESWYRYDWSPTWISVTDTWREIHYPNLDTCSTRITHSYIRRNQTRVSWYRNQGTQSQDWVLWDQRSPVPSPTVSPVPGLHGATSDIKPSLAQARTALKRSTTTETPFISHSTTLVGSKTSQITSSTSLADSAKTYKITIMYFSNLFNNYNDSYIVCENTKTHTWHIQKHPEFCLG